MKKILIYTIVSILSVLFIVQAANVYFGWYAYQKWKSRKETRGDTEESKKQEVFIRNLPYEVYPDTLKLNFSCYLEYGYTYGKHTMDKIVKVAHSDYPYQITFLPFDTTRHLAYQISKQTKADSLNNYAVFLKTQSYKDTLVIDILKNYRDTIGVIKVLPFSDLR